MNVIQRRRRKQKPGHRSWAARNGPVQGAHVGDIMSPEKRSAVMSRIRSKNTSPERTICRVLRRRKMHFSTHANDLPGRPDIIFRRVQLAVFVDGNFWHGWRFPLWQHKLSPKWRSKIWANRERDRRNFRKLRRLGWTVLRVWEHQVESSTGECLARIISAHAAARERILHRQALAGFNNGGSRGAVTPLREPTSVPRHA
jgi:DNA mismatch endonuclease (patch repair protein)